MDMGNGVIMKKMEKCEQGGRRAENWQKCACILDG